MWFNKLSFSKTSSLLCCHLFTPTIMILLLLRTIDEPQLEMSILVPYFWLNKQIGPLFLIWMP